MGAKPSGRSRPPTSTATSRCSASTPRVRPRSRGRMDRLLQTNNFFFQANQPFVKDVVNSRLDHHFGKHYLYGTYGLQKGTIRTPRSYGPDNQYHLPLEF